MRGLLHRTWAYGGRISRGGVDTDIPVLVSAIIFNIAPTIIAVRYNEPLDETSTPATGDVSVSGTTETIISVLVDGRYVYYGLSGAVEETDTILLNYTAGVNPIRDKALNEAANLVNHPVTNNVLDTFQYIEYANTLVTTPAETIYTDGTTSVRKKISGNTYQIDVTLTPTGFDGIQNTDWTWISKFNGTTAVFRSGVRAGDFVVDGTLNGTGFAGVEDTDWENHQTSPGAGVLTTYRDGVRDGAYVIDKVLTATGFAGSEDTDWENLRTYKPE